MLYHTAYKPCFHTNRKVFRATDFIAELLQHLPDSQVRLIRRYGLYSSRSRGTWLRKPQLVRLAPRGMETGSRRTDCPWHWPRGRGVRGKLGYTQAVACFMSPADLPPLWSPDAHPAVITEPQKVRKPRRG